MSNLPFWIVDVFAETKYAGNQLAVFTNAGDLSTAEMQQIAKEINFSETTFIRSSELRDGGYDVRIFTPATELPFAGHPTLGTAFVLQQSIIQQPVDQLILNLQVGQIPVTLNYRDRVPNMLRMRQNSPIFGENLAAEQVAPALGLAVDAIDSRFPIQEVSTGVPFVIVPLKTLTALQQIKVDVDRLLALVEPLQAKMVFVFCPETRNPANHFSARMFAYAVGIPEDPATGSANGCFAGYLVQHRYLGTAAIDVRVEQGYEIGRPSLLLLQAQAVNDGIEVLVGGQVVKIAQGQFV
ncbi:PhzF family phenazine biosynthesis protein [Pantanalinema sp. GBBB05]|uniref:PhzF family phenazine biosynthesis protein n=1 Tax=Pantanalinema sp. GBBB05 TaxID=2604139 RepID=UPI001D1CE9E1|nr:PhzF family phenazine biosynthesis protein [Pantanalinema sp. GBBB05]